MNHYIILIHCGFINLCSLCVEVGQNEKNTEMKIIAPRIQKIELDDLLFIFVQAEKKIII